MTVYELVVMEGHERSKMAKEMVERCLGEGILGEDGVLKVIVLRGRDDLNAAPRDLGIQKAPALYVGGKWYQGLNEIRNYLQKLKVRGDEERIQ